ncbi:MAG TPA: S8 family serine peptidase [Gammaproteobacteria bacterium]
MKLALAAGIALLAAVLAGCGSSPPAPVAPASRVHADGIERRILLTVRQPASTALGLAGETKSRYLRRRGYGPTPAVERLLNQIAHEHGLERVEGWPVASLDVYCEVFEVPPDKSVDDVIEALSADPRVDLAQRVNLFRTLVTDYDDPYAPLQPAVALLGIETAHRLATGKGVTVAVVDSGVDARHPELRGRVRIARNFVGGVPTSRFAEVHGTAVAGVIASAANNSEGIVGVAPDVSIASLRACWPVAPDSPESQCSSFSLAQALELAIELEPEVVNLSLAGPADPLLERLLDELIGRGVVVVAAEPDEWAPNAFPASHERVIVAGASGDREAPHARYAVAAPAEEILTTTPHGGYAFLSGNSLAAAHVTGVIALLLESDGSLGVERIVDLLTATSGSVADGKACVNAGRALEQLVALRADPVPVPRPVRF